MSRDGTFWMRFSHELKVPSFLIQTKPRQLQSLSDLINTSNNTNSTAADEETPPVRSVPLSQIDVTRDILDVRFILRSSVEPD
mmetsp:Transcript_34422/g.52707  ORF Transcript_34422/g.52707 Transcript_34422/m.52707 type:complete len:83 (-) Transcript_34422:416-664(-)